MFKTNGLLTIENILERVSPLDIYKKYSKYFQKIGKHFKAEFRNDPNPSAVISYFNGTYLYKDFGEDGALNCFQFVSRKYGLTFKEVLEKINIDFNLYLRGSGSNNYTKYSEQQIHTVEYEDYKTILTIKKRELLQHDLEWWGSQSWAENMLIKANINPISYFRLTSEKKNIYEKLYVCDDYSYSMDYYWHNGIFRRKLYFPQKPSYRKWLSNVDNTIVQGWDLLPKSGDICFITSSFKDTGPFWRIYNKPIAIAPNNEGSWIPDKVFYKLKKRYPNLVIYFDNDEAGIKYAKKFSQIYQIPYIHNPLRAPKDPTDMWYKDGGREFNFYLQNQLTDLKIKL